MSYTTIQLKRGGVVVAYFAPNFQVTPIDSHDLNVFVLPYGKGTKAKDVQQWKSELTVQGEFEHSTNLPGDHRAALETLFGKSPVTAMDQVNRIRHFARTSPGTFELYVGENEYRAASPAQVNVSQGVYPPVFIMEIRPPKQAGLSRVTYTIRFLEGFSL